MNFKIALILSILFSQSCRKIELIAPIGFETKIGADSISFAVIGDYGKSSDAEKSVSDMIKSWHPDFIITTGDNNYEEGKFATIQDNITQYYGDYIYNYDAPIEYRCNGKAFQERKNRFFPSPGNHDAKNSDQLVPYLNYFTLPEMESYYKFVWGPVTFYSLNSLPENVEDQKVWLFQALDSSKTPFNVVYFHHSPWSPGPHQNNEKMQWDYYHHKVDIVLTGHDHIYSRIEKKDEMGMYYIVNGLGGSSKYSSNSEALPDTLFYVYSYNSDYGAIKATATKNSLVLKFYPITINIPIDSVVIHKKQLTTLMH